MTRKRLATVIAGAGYGKSTFVAQAAQELNIPTVWYRLDSSDCDFATFLSHLIAGIRKHHPKMGLRTEQRMARAQVLHREQDAILKTLVLELETVLTGDLLIVLDDFHAVTASAEIEECVRFLIETAPSALHLVLTGRTDPGIALSRCRVAGDVLDIGEEDLAFTPEEIGLLYQRLFGVELRRQSLDLLHAGTGGWAAGLILVYHLCRGRSSRDNRSDIQEYLTDLVGAHGIIADYLEENVFSVQTEEVKNFLCKTSILSRMNANFCDRLLGIDHAGKMLRDLEEDHLFTFPFDEERQWYHYHHLFRDFLVTRLRNLNKQAVLGLHLRAAVLWEERGEEEEALKHYLAASQPVSACRLLGKMGRRKLLKEGRLQLINAFIREIPREVLNEDPWTLYVQARVFELSGRPSAAIEIYFQAQKKFHEQGNARYENICRKGLSVNYFNIGDFQRAEDTFTGLLDRTGDNPRLRFDILGFLIHISSHLGKMSVADAWYGEALSLLPRLEDRALSIWIDFNMAFRYGCSGDYEKAVRIGEKMKQAFTRPDYDIYLVMTYHLLAWTSCYLARFQGGLDYAEEGLKLADEIGINDTNRGWLLMDKALNHLGQGQHDAAIRSAEEALRDFQELECRWGQSYSSLILQQAHAGKGDIAAAERWLHSGLNAISDLDLPMDKGFLKSSLAGMLLDSGRREEARPLLEEAEKSLQPAKLFCCQTRLWQARYFWEEGDREQAVEKLLSGLNLSEANGYIYWVAAEQRWIIPLLTEAFSRGSMQEHLLDIFRAMGPAGLNGLMEIKRQKKGTGREAAVRLLELLTTLGHRSSAGLKVFCLGKFRVFRNGREITEDQWRSKKSKLLFKILLNERGKGFLPKDALIEQLWPDEDPDRGVNRLHVALSSLRRTLEPELPQGAPSSYLIREGDAYRIELGEGGCVDAENFASLVKRVESDPDSIQACLEAEKVYQGDFLQEDRYADWCSEKRELLKERYLFVLGKIIEHFETKGDYESSIRHAGKFLSSDPYSEKMYRDLMRYHALCGNRGMVVKTYKRCKEHLRKGLDASPGRQTEELYKKLIA